MKLIIVPIVVFLFLNPCVAYAQLVNNRSYTARQVTEEIKKHLSCSWSEETQDTFKSGNPDDTVTGIAVCMFPDMNVLMKAVENKCNLLIVHEPTFYSGNDNTARLANDKVYQKKLEYINEHKLIIFRFHDHWHKTVPDGIYMGMVEKLGWKKYQTDQSMLYFKFDEMTLEDFARQFQNKMKISNLRIVGDPQMRFSHVALSVGSAGSDTHLKLLNNEFTEVLVAGEAVEWETYEYVLDASLMGMKKAAIFPGHIPSEEAGMEYCASWLSEFIKEVNIIFIANGSSYWSVQ
jgi:putative NIF3 family GTP cyclohydrolase 1 type 2